MNPYAEALATVVGELGTDAAKGLNDAQIEQSREKFGRNELRAQKKKSLLARFFEQFKTCVGVPPQQYLDWARMAVATELLACGKQSLAEISDELGFAAPSHFARFFTQHMGVPPSDYRRGVIVEERPASSA